MRGRESGLKSAKAMTMKLINWYGTLEKEIVVPALGNGDVSDVKLLRLETDQVRRNVAATRERCKTYSAVVQRLHCSFGHVW